MRDDRTLVRRDAEHRWVMYAFDPSEKAVVGKRSRDWEAVGQTEVDVVMEMPRCLRILGEGRWPM